MKKFIFTVLICLISVLSCFSQKVSIDVYIDSVQIFIGQQTGLHLGATVKKGQHVTFPRLQSRSIITPGIEVVDVLPSDTEQIDDYFIKVSSHYLLTSFDDTLYRIPGLPVIVDGKKYESRALALKVLTIPVDTLHPNQYFPQKDVQDNPFVWTEWSVLLLITLLIILLYACCIIMYVRLKSRKPIVFTVRIVKRIPPHQKALNSIEEIKLHKLTSAEDAKLYYTKLTDTLRHYMMERFGFNAMEMTSSEIIECLKKEKDQQKIEELTNLFETADLVKFAKYSTAVSENDRNLISSIDFINTTKLDNMPTEERILPTATEQEKQIIRTRISLKWGIGVVSILATSLVIYVIWQLILCLF